MLRGELQAVAVPLTPLSFEAGQLLAAELLKQEEDAEDAAPC